MSTVMEQVKAVPAEVGEELPAVEHHITQEVIDRNASASLDFNPVHTDPEWCARAQVFGTPKTVAHGMFTMGLMCSVVSRAWYGNGAQIFHVESKFVKPVEEGQRLRCTGFVKEVHPRHDGGFVVVSLKAKNQEDETVAVALAKVRFDSRTRSVAS